MSAFTPGPWQCCDGPHTYQHRILGAPTGKWGVPVICDVIASSDANLIAAAPELLEALRDVMGWIPNGGAWHTEEPMKAMERARAVIAKATGGDP